GCLCRRGKVSNPQRPHAPLVAERCSAEKSGAATQQARRLSQLCGVECAGMAVSPQVQARVGYPALVEPGPELSELQRDRAARQISLPGFGEEAQRRLAAARVLVIGAGGLGSASVPYLAGAGVGTIGVVDDDVVEL